MERQALGLIETVGLVGAVEATDAAAKASSIVVIRTEVTEASLVTIYIEGDLAAVQAAVAAGVSACERFAKVLAHTVIARPHDEIGPIIDRPNQKWKGKTASSRKSSPTRNPTPLARMAPAGPSPTTATRTSFGSQDYESMTVSALRSIARRRGDLPVSGREIANADKETLVRLLREAGR